MLFWLPTSNALDYSRTAREDELGWIRENLLSKQQIEALEDYEDERAVSVHEMEQSSHEDRQPP
jgi:hypothetical protein